MMKARLYFARGHKSGFARLALAVVASLFVATSLAEDNEPIFSDCHLHLLDFLQNGEFLNEDGKYPGDEWGITEDGRYSALPYGDRGRRIQAVLKGLNRARVGHALISGMPFVKKWSVNQAFRRPKYYLDSSSRVVRARDTDHIIAGAIMDYRAAYKDDPFKLAELDRLHPLVSGFDGTDLGAVDYVIKRIQQFPGVWKGIGEVMSRHDDLTNLSTGDRPRGNHPSLLRIARFAGEVHLPVSIHHNIAPVSRSPDGIELPVNLDELVELFRYCRDGVEEEQRTTFLWCHAGISRRVTIDNLPYWIGEVLKEFQGQVYIDIPWVVLEDYIYKDLNEWVNLISQFPDSFVIGSDAVGGSSKLGKELHRYDDLLKALPEEVSTKVARTTFESLVKGMEVKRAKAGLGEGGLVLPLDYRFPEYAHTGRLPRAKSFMRSRLPKTN